MLFMKNISMIMRHFLLLLMVMFHLPCCFGQCFSLSDKVFNDTTKSEVLGKKLVRITQRWKKTNEFNVAFFYLEDAPYLWIEVLKDGCHPTLHQLDAAMTNFRMSGSNYLFLHSVVNVIVQGCLSDSTKKELARTGEYLSVKLNLMSDGRVPGVGLLFQNEQTDVVTDEEKVLIMNALTKTKCYFERFPIYSSIIPDFGNASPKILFEVE
jgi:hypothetical protein